ncbi:MAG: ATP-binding protein, partial [Pseudomonadota bacterium]
AIAAAGLTDGRFRIHRDRAREAVDLDTELDRLSQVFINVMSNARKYCDANEPHLTIAAVTDADEVRVDFIDNGTGIPVDKQTTIFEKFARVSETGAGGAGLGLAICREIMTRLGGAITYIPGQNGAAFRVTLPVSAPAAAQAAQ